MDVQRRLWRNENKSYPSRKNEKAFRTEGAFQNDSELRRDVSFFFDKFKSRSRKRTTKDERRNRRILTKRMDSSFRKQDFPGSSRKMCFFEHPYVGLFEDDVNRRVAVVGVMIVEIVDRAVLAGIATIEYSSAIREILSTRVTAIVLSALILVLFGLLHCLLFRGPRLLCAQIPLVSIAHVSWVVFLLSVLTATKTESWEPRGFVTSCFLAVAAIKLCGVAIACFGLVDMSSDWGYLVEFLFGIVFLLIGIVLMQMVPNHPFSLTGTVAAAVAIAISTLSLLDLHQNMSINSWWWEERILEGCVYQVIRQYTLTCCVRVEKAPSLLMVVGESRQDQEGRTREAATATNPS